MTRDDPSAPARRHNRLAHSTSPYLLQHAANPVEWQPWGEEAFAAARARDVPIFLSIGYSTCYWCHVMERESFENDEIAAIMNQHFVCVKVDREERPDVDEIYMAAVQAFTGHGGWPMSVFLEPKSLKPFWAGTYFPAEPRFAGMPTFPHVLRTLASAWQDQRDDVLKQADELADAVRERVTGSARRGATQLDDEQVTRAVTMLLRMFDRNHGGFDGGGGGGGGGGPKFPQPVFIELLLDARRVSADESTTQALDAAIRTTLDKMACGGIHDQVGGGFHRYSVDGHWLVPHFEKMLYDNAQLASVYARAAVEYGDAYYRRVSTRTLEYVLREMTDSATGAFFSAQDAEVDHREGLNYLWSRDEVVHLLGDVDGRWAASIYGLDLGPNFRDPHAPEAPPANVLFLRDRLDRLAADQGMREEELISRLDRVNHVLYNVRAKRKQPGLDDKSIAAWNGLMISAMARGGALLNQPRFVQAAARAADFVLDRLREGKPGDPPAQRGVLRAHRGGLSHTPGFLEDFAMVARGMADLHRTGIDPSGRYLAAACDLVAEARRRFGDPNGGFFDTRAGQDDLFVRASLRSDGALPSGFGELLHAMLDLDQMTGERDLRDRAAAAIASASGDLDQSPVSMAGSVRALMRVLAVAPEALHAALASLGAARQTEAGRQAVVDDDFTPVEIHAPVDRITVTRSKPGGTVLRVRIAPGYHLMAAGGGAEMPGLTPFHVSVIGGSGLSVFADYPAGAGYGPDGELRVYAGEFDLPIILEQSAAVTGRPILVVRFQPCTDEYCLAAQTLELDLVIESE